MKQSNLWSLSLIHLASHFRHLSGAPTRTRTESCNLRDCCDSCFTIEAYLEPVRGIEPPSDAYKTTALPLSYTGNLVLLLGVEPKTSPSQSDIISYFTTGAYLVPKEGFQPSRPLRAPGLKSGVSSIPPFRHIWYPEKESNLRRRIYKIRVLTTELPGLNLVRRTGVEPALTAS